MRIRLFLFILFLPAIWSLFLESASGQAAPPILQVSSLPASCANGALYQVNGHKSLFCANGILVPLDSGATPIDPMDYGVQANWKEFWASSTTISVSTSSTTITCNGCFNAATDANKEIVGSSNCNGDVTCGQVGLPLFGPNTTVSQVVNANTAVVSATPINSGSTSAYIAFGTNDDSAWNAVSSAVASLNTCPVVVFPAGMSNFDAVNKFNSAPASCTATSASTGIQTNVALAMNYAMAFVGYGPAVTRIVLTPAFAQNMNSPGCTKACIFGPATTVVMHMGFWGAGNSKACWNANSSGPGSCSVGAAPCNTDTNGHGTCTIVGAMNGSNLYDVTADGFGGGANATNTMIGIGGDLQDGGGVFATYRDVREDGFGNVGGTGQNSTADAAFFLDNFNGDSVCNGQCYSYSTAYGNGALIASGQALYTCQPQANNGGCYSIGDYQAYQLNGTPSQAFQITNVLVSTPTIYIDKFLIAPPGIAVSNQENGFYCNGVNNCQVHIKDSVFKAGSSASGLFAAFGSGNVLFDECGNTFSGGMTFWTGTVSMCPQSAWGSISGIQPSIAASAAIGSTGTITVDSSSTNEKGTFTITPGGTGIASSGTVTLTFYGTFVGPTSGAPRCNLTLKNGNGILPSQLWSARATVIEGTTSSSSYLWNWDNNSMNLNTGSTYKGTWACTGA